MNGQYIILNMRKAKYFVNDLLEPNKFHSCSEKLFDEVVVKYRKNFKMTYISRNTQLFEDINSNIKFKRRWL